MGVSLQDTTDLEYPICLGEDNLLHCDLKTLENHLSIIHKQEYEPVIKAEEIVTFLNRHTNQFLQLAEDNISGTMLRRVLQCVSPNQRFDSLAIYGEYGETLLHFYTMLERTDIIKLILSSVDKRDCYKLLMIKANDGCTPFHYACGIGNIEVLKIIEEHIDKLDWHLLLRKGNLKCWTSLHFAVAHGHTNILDMIRDTVTTQQWLRLLQRKDSYGRSVLHIAALVASEGHNDVIETLKDSVTVNDWIKLLSNLTADGNLENEPSILASLENYRILAQIEKAIEMPNSEGKLCITSFLQLQLNTVADKIYLICVGAAGSV